MTTALRTRVGRGVAAVLAAAVALCLLAAPSHAVRPDEVLDDPALEQRARDLSAELRCLVCQNQSIDESDAPLARDLRLIVRERLVEGDSDEEVRDYLVARYGEFVLLKPRFGVHTLALWAVAPLLLAVGGIVLWAARRRSRAVPEVPAGLSEAERAELERILRD